MVWKERGKYGVKMGWIVCYFFFCFCGYELEVLFKFIRGIENMFDNEM